MLTFEDKGIGMSRAVQSKIFERFYRQSSGNVHDVKGFGLGLNYARAIIDAHKGNVTVTSEPGKGSRFDIFLPFNSEN
jgi:two-component system phosphate regulon sensor histidine kinase PhoR